MISGITKLAITKLDVLNGLSKVKICISYELNGRKINYFPANIQDVENCKPIYKEFRGWETIEKSAQNLSEFPHEARKYLQFIENETQVPIAIVSIGPGRKETIET